MRSESYNDICNNFQMSFVQGNEGNLESRVHFTQICEVDYTKG